MNFRLQKKQSYYEQLNWKLITYFSNNLIACFRMFSPGKKKRVLPEWMTSPEKKECANEKAQKSIKNFFGPQENIVNKSVDIDDFDFDESRSGSEINDTTNFDTLESYNKPTVFIMSPAELEEVARLVLEQN